MIEFHLRNNVLPKYGFPVDTVGLYHGMNATSDKKLQMVRELQLAVPEYQDVDYFDIYSGEDWRELMFKRFTLGLKMNAVNSGSEYTKALFWICIKHIIKRNVILYMKS